jgi:hypothetical protein
MAGEHLPIPLSAKRITDETKAELRLSYFLRASDVDLDDRRRKQGQAPLNPFPDNAVIVVAGSVRILPGLRHVIFSRGSIVLLGPGAPVTHSLIVSCGDVALDCGLANSLVIARGKVVCTGELAGNRIIAGKAVSTMMEPRKCIITENESNPLGYIRWTETAKEKTTPKSK